MCHTYVSSRRRRTVHAFIYGFVSNILVHTLVRSRSRMWRLCYSYHRTELVFHFLFLFCLARIFPVFSPSLWNACLLLIRPGKPTNNYFCVLCPGLSASSPSGRMVQPFVGVVRCKAGSGGGSQKWVVNLRKGSQSVNSLSASKAEFLWLSLSNNPFHPLGSLLLLSITISKWV